MRRVVVALALVACGKSSAPNVAAALAAFTPGTKGFKFQNYGNDEGFENLTSTEVRRLFGDAVCESEPADGCTLVPAGQRWLEESNKMMAGGHCEGLATLALLFQLGKAQPSAFGAASAFDLAIDKNAALQHEIALWYITQVLIDKDRKTGTPNEIVDELSRAFKAGDESYTLAFFKPDGSGGHATTPYAIVEKSDREVWIMHYDNNFPGQEQHIAVDRKANTWSYFTAANPSEPGEQYDGDATTKTLMLGPTSARLATHACPFCGDIEPAATATVGSRQIFLDGDADLLVTDDTGKRIGHANGKLVNEIAGAQAIAVMNGSTHEPIYQLPTGHALTVTLDGSVLKAKAPADVSLVAAGYAMGVYGVALSPGEQDRLTFSADWREVSYTTDRDETPVLEIAIETPGADYELDIHAGGETGGQRVDLVVDAKAGTLAVQAAAKDGAASYTVEIHRLDRGGDQVFKHAGVSTGAADRVVFHYAAWQGNGTPMKTDIDKGSDGSIDEEAELGDED